MASGYLARPNRESAPALIVIQEYWGLVGHITDVADRFAAQGFFALAPDLYHGAVARSPDEAAKLMMALDIAEAAKDLNGAVDYLIDISAVNPKRVATVGFCMGGQLALFRGMRISRSDFGGGRLLRNPSGGDAGFLQAVRAGDGSFRQSRPISQSRSCRRSCRDDPGCRKGSRGVHLRREARILQR
jgi:hypothetical protein